MQYLYSDEDLYRTYVQRKRILIGFWLAVLCCLAGEVALIAYYLTLPYGDANGSWVIAGGAFWVITFVFILYPFMGIKFKRCNSYYRMLRYINLGLKDCSIAPFAGLEDWITREGVDVNIACFGMHSGKRNEQFVRQIYVDGEKDYPPFDEGDLVRFITQGNLLLAYEVIQKAPEQSNVEE